MRLLILLLILAAPAAAQQPARGVFQYRVDGVYEGESMEPWSATTAVRDTLDSWFVRHVVHRSAGTRFEYFYAPGKEAVWINEGRGGTSNCTAPVTTEVPDFALPHVLASKPPGKVEVTVLSCRQGGVEKKIVTCEVVATDDGWSGKGAEAYPFEVFVDKQRRVIKFVAPQGTVGVAIYTLQ